MQHGPKKWSMMSGRVLIGVIFGDAPGVTVIMRTSESDTKVLGLGPDGTLTFALPSSRSRPKQGRPTSLEVFAFFPRQYEISSGWCSN